MTKSIRADVTLVSATRILASFGILFITLVTGVQTTQADECKASSVNENIILCSKPSSDKSHTCDPGQGFVVRNLLAASNLTDKYCTYTSTDLVSVTCMRNLTGRHEAYDDVIMDIVEKVSGKSEISEMSVIKSLPFGNNAESAFVAFEKVCRPVDPEREEVINICSNETATSLTRVYLTMKRSNQTIISQEPSVCHCYIESQSTVTLRALDIRLLNYNTGKCYGTELQMSSVKNNHTETCRKKSVLLDTVIFAGIKTVNLTLGQVSADVIPTTVWIEIKVSGDYPISVTCGGPVPLNKIPQTFYETKDTLSTPVPLNKIPQTFYETKDTLSTPIKGVLIGGILGLCTVVIVIIATIVVRRRSVSHLPGRRTNVQTLGSQDSHLQHRNDSFNNSEPWQLQNATIQEVTSPVSGGRYVFREADGYYAIPELENVPAQSFTSSPTRPPVSLPPRLRPAPDGYEIPVSHQPTPSVSSTSAVPGSAHDYIVILSPECSHETSEDYTPLSDRGPRTSSDYTPLSDRGPRTSSDYTPLSDRGPRTSSDYTPLSDRGLRTSSDYTALLPSSLHTNKNTTC